MARQPMTVDQILSILRETPDRLSALTGDLAEEQLHAAPEPREWSVTEIAAHLRSCADVWGQAIERIATTDQPTIAITCSLCSDGCQSRAGREAPPCWAAADHWNSPFIHMRTVSLVTSGPTGGSWRRRYGK